MCKIGSPRQYVPDLLSGGVTKGLRETKNDDLPFGGTLQQFEKSTYDPFGLTGGGGGQIESKLFGMTGKGETPDVVNTPVVTSSPKADASKAAADAAAKANLDAAAAKKRRAGSSLTTTTGRGLTGQPQVSSSLAYGKPTLGA